MQEMGAIYRGQKMSKEYLVKVCTKSNSSILIHVPNDGSEICKTKFDLLHKICDELENQYIKIYDTIIAASEIESIIVEDCSET